MPYPSIESSRSLGEPVTLYRFTAGSRVFAYTDAEQSITYQGQEYQPIPIDRGSITTSGTLDKASLRVLTPHDTDLAELFRIHPPSNVVTLVIFEGHYGDTEFPAKWTGRVIGCARVKTQAEFTCEPIATSMRRPGLRRHYQYGCPHALYGSQCRANKAAATRTTTVAAINGTWVNLPSGWNGPHPVAKYAGGLFGYTVATDGSSELRTILQVQSSRVLLSGIPLGLVVGQDVSVSLGCNRQMDDCRGLHDNILNFGGQPWIPKKNPLSFSNIYY